MTLNILLGLPFWIGPVAVAAIVIANVVGSGMRSVTFVQAFQYWLKLTAIGDPCPDLAGFVRRRSPPLGGPLPPRVEERTTVAIHDRRRRPGGRARRGYRQRHPRRHARARRRITSAGESHAGRGTTVTLAAGAATPVVAGAPGTGEEMDRFRRRPGRCASAAIRCCSIIVATFLGTMGLPHVLVRFYTNPDGRAARRTALAVHRTAVGCFTLFPTLMGVFARLYVPQLLITGTADAAVLLMPQAAIGGPARATAGRAGGRRCHRRLPGHLVGSAGERRRGAGNRRAARSGARLPDGGPDRRRAAAAARARGVALELSRNVGLVFAVAASTLCPLLVLGIWWRGLTAAGAVCGLLAGGIASGAAAALTLVGGLDDTLLGGWPAVLAGYPAMFSVPLAFVVMIVASRITRAAIPADTSRVFARMHLPERLGHERRARSRRLTRAPFVARDRPLAARLDGLIALPSTHRLHVRKVSRSGRPEPGHSKAGVHQCHRHTLASKTRRRRIEPLSSKRRRARSFRSCEAGCAASCFR